MRVMIGFLVRGRVRFKIRIRVRVTFNNCRVSKCCIHPLNEPTFYENKYFKWICLVME